MNFESFGGGLLLLFRVFTGDSWSNILMDALDCGQLNGYATECPFNPVAPIYFVTFIVLGTFMLSLVIAVILDKFVDSAESEGLLSTNSFFDALQRKMLLDGFLNNLKQRLDEYHERRGGKHRGR